MRDDTIARRVVCIQQGHDGPVFLFVDPGASRVRSRTNVFVPRPSISGILRKEETERLFNKTRHVVRGDEKKRNGSP
jgi:hypothetical protein